MNCHAGTCVVMCCSLWGVICQAERLTQKKFWIAKYCTFIWRPIFFYYFHCCHKQSRIDVVTFFQRTFGQLLEKCIFLHFLGMCFSYFECRIVFQYLVILISLVSRWTDWHLTWKPLKYFNSSVQLLTSRFSFWIDLKRHLVQALKMLLWQFKAIVT